ncbi:MAG: glycosyltransferase family protein [Thermoplasmata archaeon]
MKIYYGVCSWGLGHATRSLPFVRALVKEGHEIVMVSTGRALELLKRELGESVEYMD